MNKKLLGYYDYTVVLTYLGLVCAVLGVFQMIAENFSNGMICLMLAGICDMFDGAVAHTKERSKPEKVFGIQIDSMCDLVSFGILPGMFLFVLMHETWMATVLAVFYILCALIRLAYFNVLEEQRQEETTEQRKTYLGLPVTSIAILLPGAFIIYGTIESVKEIVFPLLMVVVAICFLLRFELKKPKIVGKIVLIVIGIAELICLFKLGL